MFLEKTCYNWPCAILLVRCTQSKIIARHLSIMNAIRLTKCIHYSMFLKKTCYNRPCAILLARCNHKCNKIFKIFRMLLVTKKKFKLYSRIKPTLLSQTSIADTICISVKAVCENGSMDFVYVEEKRK